MSLQLGTEKIYFDEGRFNLAPLQQCITDVNVRIAEAKEKELTLAEALNVSSDIEAGMIERNFFDVFDSDSEEIKKIFSMLRGDTLRHEMSVKELWEAERNKADGAVVKTSGFWAKIKTLFS